MDEAQVRSHCMPQNAIFTSQGLVLLLVTNALTPYIGSSDRGHATE